ncbi:hypothetical protein R0131_12075 [Clostridium sp. AL.422]|uniref:hypothetical protein n=1 Tax=Clostridium TaxID=1485 RepID=UPI00293DED0D|nr:MULTISPECIES: hypothetical protein [unclassified Clostridium]MDV4151566.1 hypothetical protein [Clostridium sp. AL.422]
MKDKLLLNLTELTQLHPIINQEALFGSYRGYNISISSINYIYYIDFPIKLTDENEVYKINSFLNELTKEFKKLNYASYKPSSIQLQYAPGYKKHNHSEIILSILNKLIDFSIMNNFITGCSSCGENTEVSPFLLGSTIIPCCKGCQLEIKNTINENQNSIKNVSNNIVGGIVGGFIGALIGSVVWILIYQMNYIASIAGLAIAICCIKGYQLLGGKLNISGVVITSIITVIMVYLANHFSLAIDIYSEFKSYYEITFFDALSSVPDFLTEPELRSDFMKNLLIGYALTFIGSASYIKKSYKDANFRIKAEEVEV